MQMDYGQKNGHEFRKDRISKKWGDYASNLFQPR